jgi:hypothetical protein
MRRPGAVVIMSTWLVMPAKAYHDGFVERINDPNATPRDRYDQRGRIERYQTSPRAIRKPKVAHLPHESGRGARISGVKRGQR